MITNINISCLGRDWRFECPESSRRPNSDHRRITINLDEWI